VSLIVCIFATLLRCRLSFASLQRCYGIATLHLMQLLQNAHLLHLMQLMQNARLLHLMQLMQNARLLQ